MKALAGRGEGYEAGFAVFGRVVDAEGLAVAEALAQRSTRQQGGMSLVRTPALLRTAVPLALTCALLHVQLDPPVPFNASLVPHPRPPEDKAEL